MKQVLHSVAFAMLAVSCTNASAQQSAPVPQGAYPVGTMHLTISSPGKPDEKRLIDQRYSVAYRGAMIETSAKLPAGQRVISNPGKLASGQTDLEKLLAPVLGKVSIINQFGVYASTYDQWPGVESDFHETGVPVEVVNGNTKTFTSERFQLGWEFVVDPAIIDRSKADTVRSRLYVTNTQLPEKPEGARPITARASTDDTIKVGDVQVVPWEIDGRHFALVLQLDNVSDNEAL